MVVKWFKTGVVFTEDFYTLLISRLSTRRLEIVDKYNELNLINNDVKINVPAVWQFNEESGPKWAGSKLLCEPFIENYQKFNSNSGW